MSMQRYSSGNLARRGVYGGLMGGMGYYSPMIARTAGTWLRNNAARLSGSAVKNVNNYLAAGKMKRSASKQTRRSLRGSTGTLGVQVPAGGGGESKSYTRVVKPKQKIPVTKLLALNTVNRADGVTASCVQGAQNVMNLGTYFDATDIVNIYAALGQTSTAYNASKLLLLGIHAENLVTNATSTNTHVIIYDVMARHDGFTTVNTGPGTVFTLGGADAGGGAAADYSVVGTSPWNNPRFVSQYQIIKQTPIILAPGQVHTHSVNYKPNFIFNKERYISNSTGPIGGLTMYSFAVFHGTPVHDTATESVISTGIAKLDVVRKDSITFKGVVFGNPTNSISSSFATVTAPEQWNINAPADASNIV